MTNEPVRVCRYGGLHERTEREARGTGGGRLHSAHRPKYMFSHKSSVKMSRKLGQRQEFRSLRSSGRNRSLLKITGSYAILEFSRDTSLTADIATAGDNNNNNNNNNNKCKIY